MEDRVLKFSELCNFSPKQLLATQVADAHKYTLYGGAAGGGKSYWLRWYGLRQLIKWGIKDGVKGATFGIFCETFMVLKDRQLIKIEREFPSSFGVLKEDKVYGLCFKLNEDFGGGVMMFRNLDEPDKYASTEFAGVGVDELTMNEKETFDLLRYRMRFPGFVDTKFIAGTNPGNKGHVWVKKIWIDKVFDDNEQQADQFAFVPAKASDNPYIDPTYVKSLESLPEYLRKAYLEGSWEVVKGQYFTEFRDDKHVVATFTPPSHWVRIRCIDVSGRTGNTTCYWLAVDEKGRVWVYKEYYQTGMDSDEHARGIVEASTMYGEDEVPLGQETYRYSVMDSAAWAKVGLPETTAEVYARNGVEGLIPSSKKRVMGWDIMRSYLRNGEDGKPSMLIMDCCPELIRTLPRAVHSEKVQDDIDPKCEDDALDAMRYGLQTLRAQSSSRAESSAEKRLRENNERMERAGDYSYISRNMV